MDTWFGALLGGMLIGLSAVMLLLLNGRLAGVSGIAYGLLPPSTRSDWTWRAAFIVGLVGAGATMMHLLDQATASPVGWPVVIAAGLLVGFGTRLGNGCTSGHGVCGLARFSKRSLVAVLTFMATAVATVFVMRHVIGPAA